MKTARATGMITGNGDRLTDDELELLIWAMSLDLKGDMGLRSNAGIYETASQFEPIGRNAPARIQTSPAGGTTIDVGLRCGPVFVKKPTSAAPSKELSESILHAAETDNAAQLLLASLGKHRDVLWRCYVAKFPDGVHRSLEAFADLWPLAPETRAARIEAAKTPRMTALAFCQRLSSRVLMDKWETADEQERDRVAMQGICGEAEPRLASACRSVKSTLRTWRTSQRFQRLLKLARADKSDEQ